MKKQERTAASRRFRTAEPIDAAVFLAALGGFAWWGFTREKMTVQGALAAMFSIGVFALSAALLIPAAIRFFKGEEVFTAPSLGSRSSVKGKAGSVARIILFVLAARVFLIALGYAFGYVFRDMHRSLLSTLESIWLKQGTEAPKYFAIAEQGYSSDPSLIVFPPLYPFLLNVLDLLTRNSFASAMIIGAACTVAAAPIINELALCDMGLRSARNAVVFTFVMPAAIFFIAPGAEALFLVLSAAALLSVRKGKFWLGAIFGALASLTRNIGILMIVPFAAEAIAYAARLKPVSEKKNRVKRAIKLVLAGAVLLLGSIGFLIMNRVIAGEWFAFIKRASAEYGVGFGPFFGTIASDTELLFGALARSDRELLGSMVPNMLFIFGALSVWIFSARSFRTSYSMYLAAFIAVVCGITGFFSVPRLMTVCLALPLALSHLCESRDDGIALGRARIKAAIVMTLLVFGQVAYLLVFILDYNIC